MIPPEIEPKQDTTEADEGSDNGSSLIIDEGSKKAEQEDLADMPKAEEGVTPVVEAEEIPIAAPPISVSSSDTEMDVAESVAQQNGLPLEDADVMETDDSYDGKLEYAATMWTDRIRECDGEIERSKALAVQYPFRHWQNSTYNDSSEDEQGLVTYYSLPAPNGELLQFRMLSTLEDFKKAAENSSLGDSKSGIKRE